MKPEPNYETRRKTEFPSEIWAFINEYDKLGEYGVCAVDFENAYNEVARLREFIKSIMPPPPYGELEPEWKYAEKLLAETALAPEEPVTQENRITEPVSEYKKCEKCGGRGVIYRFLQGEYGPITCFECNGWSDRTRRPFPKQEEMPLEKELTTEWRELGPDEVIQEGDEVFSLGMWIAVSPNIIKPINAQRNPFSKYRTRRPLPVQEEKAPDDLHAWMRLQEEINREVAGELRYLRDEIKKLKSK